MKILLFGSTGMLGKAIQKESVGFNYQIVAAPRACDLLNESLIAKVITDVDCVINAAGIIPNTGGMDPARYTPNFIGPLNIARVTKEKNIPFIHISTDCVFSGKAPVWHDRTKIPDPSDIYGVSKRAGEIYVQAVYPEAKIIRTSFIGPDHGLLHWFLSAPENSELEGYEHAFWSGSSVNEVARRLLSDVLDSSETGIQHLSSESGISKYEVLLELKKLFRPDITVVRKSEPKIYRALKPSIVMSDIKMVLKDFSK